MWPLVNGVALANRDKTIFCLGSDGSQQEGNDAEAARLAVAQNLNVKLIIDDNDVTIAGHPSDYLKGFGVQKTLLGHGLEVVTVQGEDIDALWAAFAKVLTHQGPAASESPSPSLPFIGFVNACKQSCPSVSWLRGCLRSREQHTVTT
jgi:transketolase N-terminal domain/subunit